jgi:hypothetical protein
MTQLLAQIARQRSTQYSTLAETLAPRELALSALGSVITANELISLGGQRYLKMQLARALTADERATLDGFACVGGCFELFDQIGDVAGPLLRPLEAPRAEAWPDELVQARRYRGKTNELFTRFLCNIARHASGFAAEPWSALRVLDPLAGGGTTLFVALTMGAHAFGIEKTHVDVNQTAAFVRQFCTEARIRFTEKDEKLKGVGRRFQFTFGAQQLVYACGDSDDAVRLLNGCKKAHLVVTDLPYGIQHRGVLRDLLEASLPAWRAVCEPGAALAFSWDATRFSREDALTAIARAGGWDALNSGDYAALAHPVDRVIKNRDVIVARAID